MNSPSVFAENTWTFFLQPGKIGIILIGSLKKKKKQCIELPAVKAEQNQVESLHTSRHIHEYTYMSTHTASWRQYTCICFIVTHKTEHTIFHCCTEDTSSGPHRECAACGSPSSCQLKPVHISHQRRNMWEGRELQPCSSSRSCSQHFNTSSKKMSHV